MDERIAREIAQYMERAAKALQLSETIQEEFPLEALSRAYYAMFYAATAALLSEGIRRRKHGGVISAFSEKFIRPGVLERAHQRALAMAFEDREIADYQAFAEFGAEHVAGRIAQAHSFVEAVRNLLTSRGLSPERG